MKEAKQFDLIYFSPTATTRMVLQQIAQGMGRKINQSLDITPLHNRLQEPPMFGSNPILIGAPVYAGRLPKDAVAYFNKLKADGAPAIIVVVYGNRAYEDALLELKDICTNCGFTPVAGAAFIGEHSFSISDTPIAPNRPDEKDLGKAFEFGEAIDNLLDMVSQGKKPELNVPGNFPYKEGMAANAAPFIEVSDDCDECGICAAVCPKDAIDEDDLFSTDEEECIHCCACIKSCPRSARSMVDGPLKDIASWLCENFSQRKEPEVFLGGIS